MADHDLRRPMTVGGVQHLPLNRPHQRSTSRVQPTPQPLEFLNPHHRITSIGRINPSSKQLINRSLRIRQRSGRSSIGHPRIGPRFRRRRRCHRFPGQPLAQSRQPCIPATGAPSTHSLRTAPGRLETRDRSHGSILRPSCDNEADVRADAQEFFRFFRRSPARCRARSRCQPAYNDRRPSPGARAFDLAPGVRLELTTF